MRINKSNKKQSISRIILLTIITIVCIIAVCEAVYIALFSVDGTLKNINTSTNNIKENQEEILKENFQSIFKNDLVANVDTISITKKDSKYDLIYISYNKTDKLQGRYDLDINIPHINLNSEEVNNINNEIDNIFKAKGESILNENSKLENVVYRVKYRAYLNNDILSLIIECTLKENNNAQRILVKTYNYNIKTEKLLNIEDMTQIKQLDSTTIESKIKQEISSQISMEKSLQEAGYNVFNRYPESDMYKFENLWNFFLDNENNLYVIFAYGNTNNTSELDLVIF